MGRQRIHLRDMRHGGRKGGAHGSPGAHEIAVLIGLVHQLLGDDIHHGVAVGDNGGKLGFQTILHNLRQLRSIHPVGRVIADFPQLLIGMLNDRGTLVRPHRFDIVAHVRNAVGVVDDQLPGTVRLQVVELRQHFLRRPEIEAGITFLLVKAPARHDDLPVNVVLRIHIVGIAGGTAGLAQLIRQRQNVQIVIHKVLLCGGRIFVRGQHEVVVRQRLHLQIIIEGGDVQKLRFVGTADHVLEQLSHDTGAADDQSLPPLLKQRLRDPGRFPEIGKMALRNQAIQIDAAHIILCQQNDMVAGQLHDIRRMIKLQFVDLRKLRHPPGLQHVDFLDVDLRGAARVIHRPVMVFQGNLQILRHRVQLEAVEMRQQQAGQAHCIHNSGIKGKSQLPGLGANEAGVEFRVVRHDHRRAAPFQEAGQHQLNGIRRHYHGIVNAGELCDAEGNGHLRVHKDIHSVDDLVALQLHGADLDDVIVRGAEARGLDVEDHRQLLQTLALFVHNNGLEIIYKIALAAVDQLKILVISLLFKINGSIRKGLHHTMIGDGHGLHAEGNCRIDVVVHIRHAVHIRHFGMQMKLYPLFLGIVLALLPLQTELFDAGNVRKLQLLVIGIEFDDTLHGNVLAGCQKGMRLIQILIVHKNLGGNGVRIVREGKAQDVLAGTGASLVHHEDAACQHHGAAGLRHLGNGHGLLIEVAAVQYLLGLRALEGKLAASALSLPETVSAVLHLRALQRLLALRLLLGKSIVLGTALRRFSAVCRVRRTVHRCCGQKVQIRCRQHCRIHIEGVRRRHELFMLRLLRNRFLRMTPQLRRDIISVIVKRLGLPLHLLIKQRKLQLHAAALLEDPLQRMRKISLPAFIEVRIRHRQLQRILVLPAKSCNAQHIVK